MLLNRLNKVQGVSSLNYSRHRYGFAQAIQEFHNRYQYNFRTITQIFRLTIGLMIFQMVLSGV